MALRDLLERVREYPEGGSEEAAKFQVIMPILREIGWIPEEPTQVQFEYEVTSGRKRGYVDIALRAPRGRILAIIEAKAPGRRLSDYVSQVLEYAFVEGVDICALTTGSEWWLYLPREKGPPKDRRFAVLDLKSDPVEQVADDLRTFLGRDALLDHSAERRAKQALRAGQEAERLHMEMPRVWERMRSGPDHELVELIQQRVFSSVRLRPTPDQVAAMLSGAEIPVQPSGVKSPVTPPANEEGASKRAARPVGITLFGKEVTVASWKDVWVAVATEVYRRHSGEFYGRVGESSKMRGSRRQYVSRDSATHNRSERITGSSYFVEVNFRADQCEQLAIDMLELFGYSRGDLRIHFREGERQVPNGEQPSGSKRQVSARPRGVRVFGVERPVRTWKEVLLTVAEEVHRRRRGDFYATATSSERLRGRKHSYIDRSPDNFASGAPIPGSPYYIEAALNRDNCVRMARTLLEVFGYGADELEVLMD